MMLHLILGIGMITTAIYALVSKDLIKSIISLVGFSLLLSVEFFILHAPDVAIAEAAIGAGLTTAIYLFAVKSTKRIDEDGHI